MPKNYEFVVAAYGIFVGVFATYLIYLFRKARAARNALRRMEEGTSAPQR